MATSAPHLSESTWLLRSPTKDLGSELLEFNETPGPRKLRASLGFWDVYSLTITILLNGIFISHEIMQVGSLLSALILFAVASFVTLCCVAVYLELSTFLPSAGGDYEYIRVAFGNMPGFTYAWMMYIFLQTCTGPVHSPATMPSMNIAVIAWILMLSTKAATGSMPNT